MLLHSLQWIRHQFNEVITDPSCEFMLTVCSQSHGPSTVNSPQSFQPGLPANKPVTGSLGAATLGHRRQTTTARLSSRVFHCRRALVYPQPSTSLLGASRCRAMLFPPPWSCHIRDEGSPDGIRGAGGCVRGMAPVPATGKRWEGGDRLEVEPFQFLWPGGVQSQEGMVGTIQCMGTEV